MDVTTALALCRASRDTAALLLWGGAIFIAVLAPAALRPGLAACWQPFRRGAASGLAIALLAMLPVQAAALGDGWADALSPGVLRGLLLETGIGTAWMAQAAAAGLLLLGLLWVPPRGREPWVAATVALVLAAIPLTGHASMREGMAGALQRGCDVLHLWAGGFWLGALVPLLPTLRALNVAGTHRAAAVALRRFSELGHAAVALVLLTGVANTALVLGRIPDDWTSPYQRLLLIKIGLVAAMTGLALANRYLLVPRLAAGRTEASRRLRDATLAEIGLGLGAVALVAVFGLLEPT